MRYNLTEDFQLIMEVECVAQNISSEAVIELTEHPEQDSGVKLWPGKSLAIRAETYARRIGVGYGPCVLATTPLPGTGEASEADIIKLFTSEGVEFIPDLFVRMSKLKQYKQLQDALNKQIFVEQVAGMGLSANNFTDEDKAKLTAIEESAQANVIESVVIDGVEQPIINKQVVISLDDLGYAKRSEQGTAVHYKGTVVLYEDLPQNAAVGDMYNVQKANEPHDIKPGDNVVWNGASWDVLSGIVEGSYSANDYDDNAKAEVDAWENAKIWTEADVRSIFDGITDGSGGEITPADEWATDEDIENLFNGGGSSSGADGDEWATDEDIEALFR